MNSHYQQNARPWLYVKDVYVMHTGSRFCTQACTFNFLIRKAPLATLTFKHSLLLVCAELGCEYKSLSDHLHFERNQYLNLWLTTTTWQKFRLRGVSTGGQLFLLDQPGYEAWPSDDCTVPPLPCLGPEESQHWPSNSLSTHCLSDCAGRGHSNIGIYRDSSLFQNVSGRGTVDCCQLAALLHTDTVSTGKAML